MSAVAPVVLFVYNRPWHTEQCLESLMKNELADRSTLFIYADGPKENATAEESEKIKEVRNLIREKKWCGQVEIIERAINSGIGNSTINGINEIIVKYGKVIVLEDDLVTSTGFLRYMNEALNLYEKEEHVMHISGYTHPVKDNMTETFFYNATSCWGWGTWARAWNSYICDSNLLLKRLLSSSRVQEFTMDNVNDFLSLLEKNALIESRGNSPWETRKQPGWNWDVCWHTTVFLSRGFCLHPHVSLVRNIGNDGSGIHCNQGWWSSRYNKQKIIANVNVELIDLVENKEAREAVKEFYSSLSKPPMWVKVKEKLKQESKRIKY